MKEAFQAEKEISIIEILKALLSKILYLILALIIGAAAGGVFGYMTSKDIVYYGTTIQFYVNPIPKTEAAEGESIYATYGSYSTNVMKNMTNLLESEIFSEVVLDEMMAIESDGSAKLNRGDVMCDENKKVMYDTDGNVMYSGIEYTESKRTEKYDIYTPRKSDGKVVYKEGYSSTNLGSILQEDGEDRYDAYGDPMYEGVVYDYIQGVREIVEYTIVKNGETPVYKAGYDGKPLTPAISGLPTKKYKDASKKELDGTYKGWIQAIAGCTSFSFKYDANIAESFFTVKMSLNRDVNGGKGEATVGKIKDQIMISVPEFVKSNMPKPSGYVGTNCFTMDLTTAIGPTNQEDAKTEAIKMAVVFGAIALIVAVVIVIALYMSDKRLRDVEIITKTFNLPVLGIIPAIDEKALKKGDNEDNGKGGKV